MSFVLLGILNAQVAGAGASGPFDFIERQAAGASTASITFNSGGVWANYQHLLVTFDVASNRNSSYNFQDNFEFIINGDSAGGNGNYNRHDFYSQGASVSSQNSSVGIDQAVVGRVSGRAPEATNDWSPGHLIFTDINSTDKAKVWQSFNHSLIESTGSNIDRLSMYSGSWLKSPYEAITSLEFYCASANFIQHSELTLYGLGSEVL